MSPIILRRTHVKVKGAYVITGLIALVLMVTACAAPTPTATPAPTNTPRPTSTLTPALYPPGMEAEFIAGLAQHLRSIGAVVYVSEGCGYCKTQKEMFGDALEYIDMVLCSGPVEMNPQGEVCMDKGISAVPTWEIHGRFHSGYQTPGELAEISGYEFKPA